jgi:hypothetical protein
LIKKGEKHGLLQDRRNVLSQINKKEMAVALRTFCRCRVKVIVYFLVVLFMLILEYSNAVAQSQMSFTYNSKNYIVAIDCRYIDIVNISTEGITLTVKVKGNYSLDSLCLSGNSNACRLKNDRLTARLVDFEGGAGARYRGEIPLFSGLSDVQSFYMRIPDEKNQLFFECRDSLITDGSNLPCRYFSINIYRNYQDTLLHKDGVHLKPKVFVKHVDSFLTEHPVIKSALFASNFVETHGAYNLFYSLNPTVKTDSAAYKLGVKFPVLPSFKKAKRRFSRLYKRYGDKEGPFTFASNLLEKEENITAIETPVNRSPENSWGRLRNALCMSNNSVGGFTPRNYSFTENEKFVFVIFKIGNDGVPQFLKNRYVVYYSPNNSPRELNTAANATYGFALMQAIIYNIKIYDQVSMRFVRASDVTIDPLLYFKRHQVYEEKGGGKWWNIAIQVFDK